MHESFGDRARKVGELADQEARRLGHEYVGTAHILLGLVGAGGTAADVLEYLAVGPGEVRQAIEKIIESGPDRGIAGKLPQTPRAKMVIEHTIEEARKLRHKHVGTEHLLLGLLRDEEAVAAQVLMRLGLRLEDVRGAVLDLLGGSPQPAPPPAERPAAQARDEVPDLPSDVQQSLKDLAGQVEQLNEDKQTAIEEQDFEQAASLRDRADRLKQEKRTILQGWSARYAIDPSWLSWNDGTVAKLAQAIHQERRWADLPVLADALEEAGCGNAEILGHCRRPGEHHLRCWVVDLLLGRV
jgi:ATP-dependent Clp protease ATP-binding subunit ClpA